MIKEKYYIKILQAIYQEYDLNTFLLRLSKILNIKLKIKNEAKILFNKNEIIIEDDIIYKITFFPEYYCLTKIFPKYKMVYYYSYDNFQYKEAFIFAIEDNILVIEEIDEADIKATRLVKTIENDKDFLEGKYEKENCHFKTYPLSETYNYKENKYGQKEITKEITFLHGLYLYYYHNLDKKMISPLFESYIETSFSLKKPFVNFTGRIRNNNESLLETVKLTVPNIIIYCTTNIDNKDIMFELKICKEDCLIKISYKETNLKNLQINSKEENLISQNKEEFTILELDAILRKISLYIHPEILFLIIEEFNKIKKQINCQKKLSLKDIDVLDLKLNMFSSFHELALDLYENMGWYTKAINEFTDLSIDKKYLLKNIK